MKKKIITLLFAVAITTMFSASAMAAEEKMNGFYNIGANENVEITVFAGDEQVTATEKDMDGDGDLDQWYKDSNKVNATYTGATEGAYYNIIMVDGKGLPTKDTKIYYIGQQTASDSNVGFNVTLKAPENTTDMTIYMSSNVKDFKLVNIPLTYAVDSTGKAKPGDVNGDHSVNTDDIILTRRFITGGWGVSIIESAADVDADSKYTAKDVILMRRYVAGGYGVELK